MYKHMNETKLFSYECTIIGLICNRKYNKIFIQFKRSIFQMMKTQIQAGLKMRHKFYLDKYYEKNSNQPPQ